MGQHLRAIRRLGIFLSVWAVAILLCSKARTAYLENQAIRHEMSVSQAEYDAKLHELTQLLDNEQRLREDPESQVALLKEKLGYCEPGEIPIVIVDKRASTL
jgi:hypothetical protein